MIKKLVMFVIGFCLYITIEVCFRGYSFVVMGICGGILFIAIDNINNKISWNTDILLQGCIGATMITGCELIVGEVWKLFGLQLMWDYSDLPLNFDGVICLEFSLLWIILSIIAIFVADGINYYVFDETPVPYYKLFGRKIYQMRNKIKE